MGKSCNVLIVGAGPAGMMCALRLAERGIGGVLLLERNDRVGRKLSVTGNGQGNVTNEHMSAAHYFGTGAETVAFVLEKYGKDWLLSRLTELGGLFTADETGRVYPASRQAVSVTDLLRFALARAGTEVRTGCKVMSAEKRGEFFRVQADVGSFESRALVLACGGMASPHFGADGSGYALAAAFGHTLTPCAPSLVRLRVGQDFVRGLKGIRCDCAVTLLRRERGGERVITRQSGDVLFTDGGVSGDAVFRISAFAREGDGLSVNFLPFVREEEVGALLRAKAERYPQMRAEDLLRGIVHSAVGKAVLRRCGIRAEAAAGGLFKELNKVAGAVCHFTVTITGTDGFANAQVTKGGVRMDELTCSLASKKAKGLYVAGELCDVDGECGGYNLQWAFSSGACAADAIAEEVCG